MIINKGAKIPSMLKTTICTFKINEAGGTHGHLVTYLHYISPHVTKACLGY